MNPTRHLVAQTLAAMDVAQTIARSEKVTRVRAAILRMRKGGASLHAIADELGVSRSTVSNVCREAAAKPAARGKYRTKENP